MFCFADMLDKKHLASTACTMLDWHIAHVEGMCVLHPLYAVHLAQGIIDYTGMEAQ